MNINLNSFFRIIGCGIMILGLSILTFAQFKAGLQGTVSDNNGAIVANAAVTLKNNETNQTQTTTASDSGFYRFSSLAPGSYTVTATKAQRQFFIDVSNEFPGYSANEWGLTASDSENGYIAWGAPPRPTALNGTIVPCAAAGSLMFTPDISLAALQDMKSKYGDKIYKYYGFADAFNPKTDWTNPDVIGIDLGITLLSAENARTGKSWFWLMRNPEIIYALRRVDLR